MILIGLHQLQNAATNNNEHFKIQEFDQAVKNLASGKSPGPDGLTAEFYQTFWDLLRLPYYQAITQVFQEELLYSLCKARNSEPNSETQQRYTRN